VNDAAVTRKITNILVDVCCTVPLFDRDRVPGIDSGHPPRDLSMGKNDDSELSDGASASVTDARPSRYRWDTSRPPSDAVAETVAGALDCDPADLPSLDAALDALFADSEPDVSARVEFECDGATVTVGSEGEIEVRSPDARHDGHGPETGDELERELGNLLHAAARGGVSVVGGYRARNGDGAVDWDIHVTAVERTRGGSD
jgi:hypothetical protein